MLSTHPDQRHFYGSFSQLAPHWQCPWYTGSSFSSSPACNGWGSEQSSVEQKHDQQKTGSVPLINAEEPKVASWQPSHANGSAQLPFSRHCCVGIVAVLQYRPSKCLCRRGCLSHSLACQTQLTSGRIAFSKPDLTNPSEDCFCILTVIHAGVGWVWLAILASHARLVHLFSLKPKFAPRLQVQSSHASSAILSCVTKILNHEI